MVIASIIDVATKKPELELADIFREYFEEYRQLYGCSWEELKAVNAIMKCRTAQMGGLLRVCDGCGRWQLLWKSCKNRNCNKCGAFEKAQWLARLTRLLLPTHYHQVVFTVDHEINELAYHNQKLIYDLLFQVVSETLKEFGQRYLGGLLGFTAVLHTWGQQMQPHIHLHCMVPGGALVRTREGYAWRRSKATFLFPVVELSAAYRERFCAGVMKLHKQGKLRMEGRLAQLDIEALVARMRARKWEVYIQKPPLVQVAEDGLGAESQEESNEIVVDANAEEMQGKLLEPTYLAEYLGRYVHQNAISNSRLISINDGEVSFTYYDNRERDERGRGTRKEMALNGVEFIRRFLWHVLPKGYVRVRHYGLHASGCRAKLEMVRFLLGLPLELPPKPQLDLSEWLESLGVEEPNRCPFCESGVMRKARKFGPMFGWRLWLFILLGVAVRGQVVGQERPP